jgi:hypothetical protein
MTSGHQHLTDLMLVAGIVGVGLGLRWIAQMLLGG